MKHVIYIRAGADGEVYSGPGQCDAQAFDALKGMPGNEDLVVIPPGHTARIDDKIDRKTLKIVRKGPAKKVNLAKVLEAAAKADATSQITVEELADALLGDKKALATLKRKRKKG